MVLFRRNLFALLAVDHCLRWKSGDLDLSDAWKWRT